MVRAWVVAISLAGAAIAEPPGQPAGQAIEMPLDVLSDKIQGGLLGQLLGNLNGLPHELKYNNEPGKVTEYLPALPEGARTDDDSDIEWVYIVEMQRSRQILIPPPRIADLWRAHINDYIWCANRHARALMDLGIEPPLTGRIALNPWSDFNISGQFVSEAFGLVSPAMPQTAAKIGLHYTHVSIDAEPAQATQFFTTMIATAFVESEIDRIISAGLMAVDPRSDLHAVIGDVRAWWRQNPDDWQITWRRIHSKYVRHGGTIRDFNGHELNTAAIVGSLLYGRGDFVESLRMAFNFGWDADCNAATAGTIVGVIKGRRWMDAQGWTIKDVYRNITRPGMPTDETITRYGERLVDIARLVIIQEGGQEMRDGNRATLRIRPQQPTVVENLPNPPDRMGALRSDLLARLDRDLAGKSIDQARAAYLAICLGEAERLSKERPEEWRRAIAALQASTRLIDCLFKAPPEVGKELQNRARKAGLKPTGNDR